MATKRETKKTIVKKADTNSAAKKQGANKTKSTKNTSRARVSTNDDRTMKVLVGLIFIVLGVFFFAAVQFQAAGQFGNVIGNFLKGTLGLIGIIFPFYLIIFGLLMLFDKTVKFNIFSFSLGILILLMLCIINSARFVDVNNIVFNAKDFFDKGVVLESGGLLGMGLASFFIKYIGRVGLYAISLAIIIISFFLLLKNTPIKNKINDIRIKLQEMSITRGEKQEEKQRLKIERQQQKEQIKENRQKIEESKEIRRRQRDEIRARNAGRRINAPDLDKITLIPRGADYVEPKSTLDIIREGVSGGTRSNTYGVDEPRISTPGMVSIDDVEVEDIKPVDKTVSASDISNEPTKVKTPAKPVEKPVEKDTSTKAKDTEPTITNQEAASATLNPKDFNKTRNYSKYKKPGVELLNLVENKTDVSGLNDELRQKARLLEDTLRSFNVEAKVVQVTQGPAVTRYEIQPSAGVKVSKIVNLSNDIALNLRAKSIRIEAPIPGKAAVGIEVENDDVNMVTIRDIINSKEFKNAKSKISFCVGRDIAGKSIVADLKTMPHLLIAGSTGSGKSVCINGIITSILYKANPDEVKLILIDPKVVELGDYNGIPHLLIPVVTDPAKAAAALNWAVKEMSDRYELFAAAHVRDLETYNEHVDRELKRIKEMGKDYDSRSDGIANPIPQKLPQVVIIIDELADLMMAAPSQVEDSICRLAQLARAAGMHLIVATQRPSVDVITGLIKANIPSRIAFAVASQFDSRTILDMSGAEKLVGKGDMLYSPLGMGHPIRVQGCFISDDEIHGVIQYVKNQGDAEYSKEVQESIESGNTGSSGGNDVDELFDEAVEFVISAGKASTSLIQRRFRIGYNRAANIIDEMEARGIIGPAEGSKPRQVLITAMPARTDNTDDYNDSSYDEVGTTDVDSQMHIVDEPAEFIEEGLPEESLVDTEEVAAPESKDNMKYDTKFLNDLWDDIDNK